MESNDLNDDLYSQSLDLLNSYKRSVGRGFKGRFIQIFLALKFFQEQIPSIFSGRYISSELLQTMLDDLYSKASREADRCVLSVFENNHLARTGIVAEGHEYPQNTWRNNFNIQKGIGCYAPASDLSSPTFLNQRRVDCRHLQPEAQGEMAGATCRLCISNATYRSESHRKWLKIEPNGSGYAVVDLQWIDNFIPYLSYGGRRTPLFPLLIAIYYDANPGLVLGQRLHLGREQFKADFNLSNEEFEAYFDESVENPYNKEILRSINNRDFDVGRDVPEHDGVADAKKPFPAQPIQSTEVAPPALNSGWEAEQFVIKALQEAGWSAHNVSRQSVGYDIFATKEKRKIHVEVKSSINNCFPVLTSREWQKALYLQDEFVLAIVENFNPDRSNNIYWVLNPSRNCVSVPQETVDYRIVRSAWLGATTSLDRL